MTNEATRLAEEAKWLAFLVPNFADYVLLRDAIDALATLAQPAPTAEVALPAVSEADHPLHRCCDCPACTAYFADNPISNSDGAIYARSQTAAKDDAMASQEKTQ